MNESGKQSRKVRIPDRKIVELVKPLCSTHSRKRGNRDSIHFFSCGGPLAHCGTALTNDHVKSQIENNKAEKYIMHTFVRGKGELLENKKTKGEREKKKEKKEEKKVKS